MGSPLRIGILGTAKIARSFALGVRPSHRVTVSAVASRNFDKAKSFAAELQIGTAFGSYEDLLAAGGIDAVYIPLPNSLHAGWSIKALRAGKHVLCEKPLAVSAREARAMFDAARDSGKYLVEGYPYLAQSQTRTLRDLVRLGTLGDLRLIQASFGFTLSNPHDIRLSPQLAGGAAMDVGVYPVSLIRILAGQLPTRVHATAHWSDESSIGVDRSLAATLEFGQGLLAQLTCAFDTCVHRQALIVGSAGVVQTPFLNHTSAQTPGVMQLRLGTDSTAVDSVLHGPFSNGFLGEAESFAAMIDDGPAHWSGATREESIDIALILETLLRSARSGRAEPVS